MTDHINLSFYRDTLLSVIVFVLFSTSSIAQGISGPNTVQTNATATYTLDHGVIYSADNWIIQNGTLISNSASGTTYTATIQWGNPGNGSITFRNRTIEKAILLVTVEEVYVPPVITERNHVYNVVPRVPTTDVTTLSSNEKIESIGYFDGLGRPVQQVAIETGGNSEDIITHIDYDEFGRSIKEYLPYSSASDIGSYRVDALSAVNAFHNTAKYENTTNPYSEKEYEASPLNRVLKQAAPGEDWKLGSGYEIKFDYQTNSGNEVWHYTVSLNFASNTYRPTLTGGAVPYPANSLYKTITKDENWKPNQTNLKDHTTEEFKNKQGQILLKRTYNNNVKHDTYYVYDDYGNLSYVLPPKAEPHTAMPDSVELSELCYQYVYDDRNRLVEKKIPGKGWEHIVYNKLDQPILIQDAVQRAKPTKEWLFTKYDAFSRVIYTGLYKDNSTRESVQNSADASSSVSESYNSVYVPGTLFYYTNNAFPTNIPYYDVYTINYYGDYVYWNGDTHNPTQNIYGKAIMPTAKGSIATSKVKVLETTSNWVTTITGYDDKARPIYVYVKNDLLQTTDIVHSKLNFQGQVEETTSIHTKGGVTTTVKDYYIYDHANRLISQTQTINAGTTELIAKNHYDELGQLVKKDVGNSEAAPLQEVDYTYNIRGWLKQINNPTTLGSDLFGFKINYNDATDPTKSLFNGNISQTFWETASQNTTSNPVSNSYTYTYDALNRIEKAIDNTSNYNLQNVDYDKNGNIVFLARKGQNNLNATSFGFMDVLAYEYDSGNKLTKVSDNGPGYGFKDGTNTSDDYTYDANGNMIEDKNKNITSITYNHLNLPTSVVIQTMSGPIPEQNIISYTYDATGVKLEKKVEEFGAFGGPTYTYYAGNYIYEKLPLASTSLKFFSHPEGYVEPDGGDFNYIYQYKDHLGNIRLSYTDSDGNGSVNSSEIIEENNYYPFGLKHKGYNNVVNGVDHKYGFGGKEENDELGLKWLDFSARNYDVTTGRWMNLDPLAEQMRRHSPYNFAFDNPVYWVDPDGMRPFGGGNTDPNNPLLKATRSTVVQDYPSGRGVNPLPSPVKGLKPFLQSQKTKDFFSEGTKLLKNAFKPIIKAEAKLGVGGDVKAGPFRVKGEANVGKVVGYADPEKNRVGFKMKVIELKASGGVGPVDKDTSLAAGFKYTGADVDVSINASPNEDFDLKGSVEEHQFDSFSTLTNGQDLNLTLKDNLTFGGTAKIGAISVGGLVDIYSALEGTAKMLQGIGSWVGDYMENTTND